MTYTPTDPKMAWLRNLFVLRRNARLVVMAKEAFHFARQSCERAAIITEQESPFNKHRAEELRSEANQCAKEASILRKELISMGKMLLKAAPYIDHATTLQERCEALNVNMADRVDLTEEDGIVRIIFAHGLEDSAMYRGSDRKNGPLFSAIQPTLMDWAVNTPEGQAASDEAMNDVFGDAWPFFPRGQEHIPVPDEPVPARRPALTANDRYGSRIISRPSTLVH